LTNLICTQIISFQRDLNWHLSNIIDMFWFIDTIVIITEGIATNLGWNVPSKFMTKCCSYYGVNESEHVNNVWEMSVQISLEANDLRIRKTYINFIPCSSRTITIIFFGTLSIHCGGHHPVSVMVNTLNTQVVVVRLSL
jgi:hypothetical protein